MFKAIKSKYVLSAALGCSLMLGACDNINEDDRYIPVERPKVERKVLVQEFTGIRCINCPDAAALMHSLQESYPSVIVVGIHPADHPFSQAISKFSLATETGKEYFSFYNGNELPAAVVNSGSLNSNYNQWSSVALTELAKEAKLDIDVTPDYEANERNLIVDYKVKFNTMYSGDLSVLVWVIENDIIGPQQTTSGREKEYNHSHVFRATLNGTWGDAIGSSFTTDQEVTGRCEILIPDDWKIENCQVVAFAFRKGSQSIDVENAEVADAIPSSPVE